jgi:hypothetical protein
VTAGSKKGEHAVRVADIGKNMAQLLSEGDKRDICFDWRRHDFIKQMAGMRKIQELKFLRSTDSTRQCTEAIVKDFNCVAANSNTTFESTFRLFEFYLNFIRICCLLLRL